MKDSDALFILTEWKQFGSLDLDKIKGLLKNPVIFDGRNMFKSEDAEKKGFTYFCIGKRTNGVEDIDAKSYK